jgi:hypothetical protein
MRSPSGTRSAAVPDRDKIELIQCNYVLQILLELCFLKSMTLEEETIAALAKKCDRYRKIRERFFSDDAAKEQGAKAQGAAGGD